MGKDFQNYIQAVHKQNLFIVYKRYNGMLSQIQARNRTKRIHLLNCGNHSN